MIFILALAYSRRHSKQIWPTFLTAVLNLRDGVYFLARESGSNEKL